MPFYQQLMPISLFLFWRFMPILFAPSVSSHPQSHSTGQSYCKSPPYCIPSFKTGICRPHRLSSGPLWQLVAIAKISYSSGL